MLGGPEEKGMMGRQVVRKTRVGGGRTEPWRGSQSPARRTGIQSGEGAGLPREALPNQAGAW